MAAPATATSAVRLSIGAQRLFHLRSFAPLKQTTLSFTLKCHHLTCSALHKPALSIKEESQPETLDYRVFFLDSSAKKVSPRHDIPLRLGDGAFNFVVEIPKEMSAKMEVATDEPYTPIKQDTKKGKLRYYPYNINWNYGLLPQTWEDPSFANAEVEGACGDNDPVDVVEIGAAKAKIGDVLKVKPLGTLAMLDEGELDWKIIAISLDDPRASLVNDVNDVEKHLPGTLTAIRDWFKDYKIPDGKPANRFGLGNKAASKEYALKVISEANEAWAKLVKRTIPAGELSLNQMSTPHPVTSKKTEGKTLASASPRNKLDPHQILMYPLSTESAVRNIEENNNHVFVVVKKADKKMIRAAVEEMYGIQVKKVNTAITPDGTKKAFVKLSSRLDLNL